LEVIVPQIYKVLIQLANRGYAEDLKSSFIMGALNFIPNEDNELKFLEINVTPGRDINFGLNNYHEFYELVTNFMLGER